MNKSCVTKSTQPEAMPKKFALFLLLILISNQNSFAQLGGSATYSFLNLPTAARQSALGGNVVSIRDFDLNMAYNNPSLLNREMDKQITFNYVSYLADIKYGYTAFSKSIEKIGNFSAGLHFVDYGNFDLTDEYANVNGTFSAGEYSFNLSGSRMIDSVFAVGVTLKTIYSSLESYKSFGLAADVGVSYISPDRLTTIALVVRNGGKQLKTYTSSNDEPLPLEVEVGITKRLPKAPLRLTITLRNLQKWDLTYLTPADLNETDPITGEIKAPEEAKFFDKALRHVILSTEVLISKNFHLRFGYNFQRRKEFKIEERSALVGLSGGFGIKISKFHLSYARSSYHVAGGTNSFCISTYLSDFVKKK